VSNESAERAEKRVEKLANELFDLSIALDLIGNAAASRIGINQTDLICLNLLVRHGPMSPGQIAANLGLTTAAISAMASRLEAGNYVSREIDPSDRRRILMQASEAGAERAFSQFDGFYQAVVGLFEAYGERDQNLLMEVLAGFRQILVDQAAAIKAG